MARDGSVLIKFLADTLGFRRGTDDMADAIHDAAQQVDRDTDDMARSFRDAGQKIDRTTREIGHDAKKNAGETGKEIGGELIQNMGEGIGSGQPNLTDAVLGTIGGIAPALGAAGVGVAIGATAVLGIVNAINDGKEKARQAASDLFDAMREGIVTAAAKEDLLQRALGVDNMYDAMGKVTRQARDLGVPVADVLTYLETAGRVATPALTTALAKAKAEITAVQRQGQDAYQNLSDAALAADDLTKSGRFAATAWQDAAAASSSMRTDAQATAVAMKLASQRAKEYASYAARQYAAGNPAYGGAPGGKRT